MLSAMLLASRALHNARRHDTFPIKRAGLGTAATHVQQRLQQHHLGVAHCWVRDEGLEVALCVFGPVDDKIDHVRWETGSPEHIFNGVVDAEA
ncbi:hypothetical protein MGG_18128 [Pyricularia oryzae 70-15]|uniref:Uncharacterized protein n=3 Tax=Pyricularia oryzae TaxID=318829 RepID=Q2KEQ2_PYRO7|nr:uncharacterized protein MGG_18128 [Pyricularia oryzae 70-15]EAQ71577.1 hypothetical protein MGCH7_ch7g984 [Pyricularia oryzae 70-15]ELQ35322.1 hypothetical protein OOU_Y34scaffold00713g4 [Pyricularia oryzae Y34]KYQ30558.1 hypothetical protein MGG_18128 [Pyricularia oryzae 70-15]